MIASHQLTITLRAPWLSRDNHVGLFGIDAPLARLPDGRHYLPGTLLVGRLAEAFDHLGEVDERFREAASLFFPRNGLGADVASGRESRRRLFISDLVLKGKAPDDGLRTRIAIDSATGRVLDGALQVIEAPFGPGKEVQFRAIVRLLGSRTDCDTMALLLGPALQWLTQLGGGRTYGHGVVEGIELAPFVANKGKGATVVDATRLRLRIQPQDPLCVGEKRTSPNSYSSSDVIAGGVIKGALANNLLASAGLAGDLAANAHKLKGLEQLASHFSALHISHAFPATVGSNARPRRAPFSLASKDGAFADMAMLTDPEAPQPGWSFEPNWKPETIARHQEKSGWPDVGRDFRIRTAIDTAHRASAEGRLFAVDYIDPAGHEWIAHVNVAVSGENAGVSATDIIAQLQTAMADGLAGVGRGGAFCKVTFERAPEVEAPKASKGDRIILTLQTPALLRVPTEGETGDVTQAYRIAFADIGLPGLRSIFIRERLHGAQFFARRLPDGTTYKPWLLTRAGSCFVFDVAENPPDLATLQRFGLAVPDSTAKFYGLDLAQEPWRHCPYLPENGYGEVDVRVVKQEELHDAPKALGAQA
jgi:hypothetical protein